ncbi:uncharacterized protein LOC127136054 [Lathyrus oleraceus]|uniref:uncharacterized protein LOC127136054 n=1 Tax=Pisum sativum TaxID=3888 RepID=UPI0021CE2A86|nr:uncharacterized protein LOC127136054 [Pisum sativum]
MVGVSSTKKTFLESEKKENVTWTLKVCLEMLKDQEEIPKVIVIDRDTSLMNSVAKVFPNLYALLCRYHITKNVKRWVKPAVGMKHIKAKDGKMVNEGMTVEQIMDAWKHIVKEKIVCAWTGQLVDNISRASLNYIFHEAKQTDNVGSDSAKCVYIIVKTYGLPCACVIAKKVKLGSPIIMDEVLTHWKRLRFDDTMIAYLETTDLKPPSQPTKTKGDPKTLKPTLSDTSTVQSHSFFEHVKNVFSNSPTPKYQKSVFKGARISKPPPLPSPPKILFIDEMPLFMHKYIEWIVNVKGDDNYGYRAVSNLLGKGEDNQTLVHHQLIQELMTHKESYTQLYRKKENFDEVYESLVLCLSGPVPEEKWMCFSEMGHLIACPYDRVCIDLIRYGFSETFFSLDTVPPQNPNDRIICIG